MPTKRARVRARRLPQGFRGARPGQRWVVGGLMAPGATGERRAGGTAPGACGGCAALPRRRRAPRGLGAPSQPSRGEGCAPRAGSAPLQPGAHRRSTFAPSPRLCSPPKGSRTLLFLETSPCFSSLLSTPCPLLGGTAQPPHYGRGREEFQQHPLWHREASGRRGGLTREELGAAPGRPDGWQGRRRLPGQGPLVPFLSSCSSSNCGPVPRLSPAPALWNGLAAG